MSGENESRYVDTKSGPTYVRGGTAFLRDKAHPGQLAQVDAAQAEEALSGPDYLPATAEDVAAADVKAANSTLGAKIATTAEAAGAGFIDAVQAPLAAPARLGAALAGKEDPLKNISGRATIENLATIFGEAYGRHFGEGKTGEAYGREYAEGARERAEQLPGYATAGNIIGTVAAGGVGGGPGALAEGAGAALGKGALGAAARGALEGAAYGSAQAGEEAYLQNIPLTGEKMLAAMGMGAVLGGGVSLAAHGAGALLRRGSRGATPIDGPRLPGELPEVAAGAEVGAAEGALDAGLTRTSEAAAATESKLASGLREFADNRVFKALGGIASTAKKMGRTAEEASEGIKRMTRALRDITLEDGQPVFRALDSQETLAERVAVAKEAAGAKLEAFRNKADDVFRSHPEIAPKADAIAERIAREVAAPLEEHPLTAIRAQAGPIRRLVDDIRALEAKSSVGRGKGGRLDLGAKAANENAFPLGMRAANDNASGFGALDLGARGANDNARNFGIADLTKLRQGLDEQIYQAKKGVNLAQQGAPPALKDLERARMILEESIEAASDKAATFFDKAEAQSYKEMKTQWRNLHLADQIAGEAAMRDLGNRVISPSDYWAGGIGAMLGGGGLGSAVATVGHKVAREHSSAVLAVLADKLAASLDGKIEKGLGAFFRESAERASPALAGLDKAAAAVPLKRLATPTAVEAFQGKAKDLPSAYEKRVREITDATRDGGAGARGATIRAMGGAAEFMPKLTAAATVTATRGAQYLESQLPAGTAAPTMFQPSRSFTPSDLQIREFAQKWSAVSNPLSVVDDLRRGTVTHAQIDALKNVYPELYDEVRVKALEGVRQLDQSGKRMPLNDRLQLDLFLDLGGAGEPTLAPGFIDRMDKVQAEQQKNAGPRPTNTNSPLNRIGKSRASGSEMALGQGGQ